jgi:hypothetical protein
MPKIARTNLALPGVITRQRGAIPEAHVTMESRLPNDLLHGIWQDCEQSLRQTRHVAVELNNAKFSWRRAEQTTARFIGSPPLPSFEVFYPRIFHGRIPQTSVHPTNESGRDVEFTGNQAG